MPQARREQIREQISAEHASRIVTGPDPDRFYCPHPGCNRSFAELWRLKVHYRAPPDVRGSGKERGHGTELKFCPKCGKELKPGKHHVGCSAGKSAPRQAAKRQRQMSTTTESDWVSQTSTGSLGDANSDSWEDTVRRQVSRVQRQRSLEDESGARYGGRGNSVGGPSSHRAAAAAAGAKDIDISCRVNRMQQMLTEGDNNAELVFTANTMADFGLILRHGRPDGELEPAPRPTNHEQGTSPSPSLANLLDNPRDEDPLVDLAALPNLRVPSPPPLPPDWDMGVGGAGGGAHNSLLFDFDQFDANRRTPIGGLGEPYMTVTSAMNPAEMSNPSDDYIWQIMFAGENEVPKRVTAHLHHPADTTTTSDELARMFEEPDPVLDAMGRWDGTNGTNGNHEHGGSMQPPPARQAAAAATPALEAVPPPPAEALVVAEQAQQPQTITVTYVVQPGADGQPQYAVKSVKPESTAEGADATQS